MENIVLQQQQTFFGAVEDQLKELDKDREKNQLIDLIFSGAYEAYKQGMTAYSDLEQLLSSFSEEDTSKKLFQLLQTEKLPSHIYSEVWGKQEEALFAMIEKGIKGNTYQPQQINSFYGVMLAFENPTITQVKDQGSGLLFPLIAGVAGYFLGKS